MKKSLILIVLVLVCTLVLTGCFCQHEWAEANCVSPKTCTKCEKTEGEALGHVWMAATCTESKTCEVCSATAGEAKGHAMVDATCEEAKHCTQCNLVEGAPLGHTWQDATTEAPKTCTVCSATEGERIVTDTRFTTAANASLFGKWAYETKLDSAALGIKDFEGNLSFVYLMEFSNAGDFSLSIQIADEESFMEAIILTSIASTYEELEMQGISKEEADAAMRQQYGMDVTEYMRESMKGFSMNELLEAVFAAVDLGGVYYVDGDKLYCGDSWDSTLDPSDFTLNGDTLFIAEMEKIVGPGTVFTRVVE